jgi:riboflavin biosynthesis pyrimidine reductase
VRQLVPTPVADIDPADSYADMPSAVGRPGVRVNMIASVDGAVTIGGVSGPLGGPADRVVYRLLRSLCDVVLVAAGTARTENYKPALVYDEYLQARRDRGQPDAPRIAIVSRSLEFDWDLPLFRDVTERTIVVTTADAPPDRLRAARAVCDVIAVGQGTVDLHAALVALGERGANHVLAEGGPSLNGALTEAGLVDEVCLTIAPLLAGGEAKRILSGPDLPAPCALELRTLLEADGFLLARYRRVANPPVS